MLFKKFFKVFMLFVMCWNDYGVGIVFLLKFVGEVLGGVKGLIDNVFMVVKVVKKYLKLVELVILIVEKFVFFEDGGLFL